MLKSNDQMSTLRVEVLRTAAPNCEVLNFSAPLSRGSLSAWRRW